MPRVRIVKPLVGFKSIKTGSPILEHDEDLYELLCRAGVNKCIVFVKSPGQKSYWYRGSTESLLCGLKQCGYKILYCTESRTDTVYVLHKNFVISPAASPKQKTCAICMDEKTEENFFTLQACKHDFCRECLERSITVAIVDRNVKSLKCLSSECSKLIDYLDVSKLLDAEMFKVFDRSLTNAEIIGMMDVATCPNEECGLQSYHQVGNDEGEDSVVACPHCLTEFCALCKKTLRGELQGDGADSPHQCEQSNPLIRQAVDAYGNEATTEGDRQLLENAYGKAKLQNWVDNRRSERVIDGKKKCPHCRAPTDKDVGCNHMTCRTCNTDWCWMCCAKIDGPWRVHFNEGECSGRLLEGVVVLNQE